MHNFEVHSNESTCRKSGRLGLEQVSSGLVFLFLTMGVEMDEKFNSNTEPYMSGLNRMARDEKVKVRGEEGGRKMVFDVCRKVCGLLMERNDDDYIFDDFFKHWNEN